MFVDAISPSVGFETGLNLHYSELRICEHASYMSSVTCKHKNELTHLVHIIFSCIPHMVSISLPFEVRLSVFSAPLTMSLISLRYKT